MSTASPARRRLATPAAFFIALLALIFPLAPLAAADTTADPTAITGDENRIAISPAPLEGEEHPSRVSFDLDLDPGQSAEEQVRLYNYTDRDVTLNLEAADGMTSDSGAFDVLPPGTESADSGTWVELAENQITVPARDTAEVGFTVTVPEDATPGDHPAGITAFVAATEDQDVSFVARVGVRLHIQVSGEITPSLAIQDLQVEHHYNWIPFAPGSTTVSWSVANDGNVRLGATQTVTSAGPFGLLSSQTNPEPTREILPGQASSFQVTQEGVWPLFAVSTEVSATSNAVGEDQVANAQFQVTESATVAAIPWSELIVIIVIILLVIWWLRHRKKTKQAEQEKFAAAVEEAVAAREQRGEN